MDKVNVTTGDLTQGNIRAIANLFPSVVTEALSDSGEVVLAVDFDLLRQELSEHVIEGPRERYQLDWPGKRASVLAGNAPTRSTLRPVVSESEHFDATRNLFIEGDNLEALKLLQESYLGRVKLIYIDPPYNTGKDFIYADDFSQSSSDYLERSGQVDDTGARLIANVESNGRFHSDWLSMILPRLRLARNLLSDDGVILISIDDHELARLLMVCDEVFGSANHVCTFVWKSKSGGANDSSSVAVDHEYLVCYSRRPDAVPLGLDLDAVATTSYSNEDHNGRYALERLDKQNLQYSASLDYELVGPDGTIYRLTHRDPSRPNAVWRWSKKTVQERYSELVFKDGNVYTKNYEKPGGKPRSLLVDERFGRTRTGSTDLRALLGGDFFDNPKPAKLIEFIVGIATTGDSIVLDFFAGSGTTAQAVVAANARDNGARRWICVQLPEAVPTDSDASRAGYSNIAQVSRKRIRMAAERIAESAGLGLGDLDLGFRTLRVDSGSFVQTLESPDGTQQTDLLAMADNIKPDRTSQDLLFQVLVDWGLELTLPIKQELIDGVEVLDVDDGALLACFEPGISDHLARQIAARMPLRAVFRDSSFTTDAERINVEQIFREVSKDSQVKVI